MADDNIAQLSDNLTQTLGAALIKSGKEIENLSKKGREAAGQGGGLQQLDTMFQGMTKNLVGPVGLAAAIYAVGKSLENLAVGRLQLQNFSKDTGATVPMINAMTEALKKAGISAEAGHQSVGRLAQLVQGLAAEGFGSELGKLLLETGRSANEIQKLIDTAKTNTDKAMLDTVDILRRGNAQYQSYTSQRTGIYQSHLQAMQGTQEEMNKVYVADVKAAQKWHDDWSVIARGISNTWESLADNIRKSWAKIPGSSALVEELEKRAAAGGGGIDPDPKSIIGRMSPGGAGFAGFGDKAPDWLKRIIHPEVNKQWPFSGSPSLTDLLMNSGAGFPDSGGGASFDERFRATDFSSRNRMQELVSKGLGMYQSGVDWVNNSGNAPIEDRNKSALYRLHETIKPPDIESIIDQMMPMNPLLFMKHAAKQYTDGSNFTDRFSAIWDKPGGSSTDFSARQKIDDLISIEKDSSKTLLDIRDILQGGDVAGGGRDSPGSNSGGGRRSLGARLGMEGSGGSGGGSGNSDYTPSGEPVAGLKQDRERFAKELEEDPDLKNELFKHMVGENNNPLAQQALIETAMNRASERRTSLRAQLAYFQGYRAYNQNQKIVLEKNLESVLGGSNVSMGSTDNSSQGLAEREASSGKFIRRRKINGESFFIPGWAERNWQSLYPSWAEKRGIDPATGEARAALDKAQSTSQQNRDASMSATIDFKNMPSWVRSSVDSNGVFRDLRVTRSTPQGGKASSPQGDLQNWSYE